MAAKKAVDEEPISEDPVKRETSLTAAVLLRRAMVDRQMCDTERTIAGFEERNADSKAQIARRRNAQAEVYSFVNKRLEENFDSIASLERSIGVAEGDGRAAREAFLAEERALQAGQDAEIARLENALRSCDAERAALEAFAGERGGLTAHLVAVHARCELIEEDRRRAKADFHAACEVDRATLEREAAEAAAAARKLALEDAKARLDAATRRRITALSQMKKELALHGSEATKLVASNAKGAAAVADLKAKLRTIRRKQRALARSATERKNRERGEAHLKAVEAEDRAAAGDRERGATRRAAEDAADRARRAALRNALEDAERERDAIKAECDSLKEVHGRITALQDYEVAALFVAAKTTLPNARRPSTIGAEGADRGGRDAFVDVLFDHLYHFQHIKFEEEAEVRRRAEGLAYSPEDDVSQLYYDDASLSSLATGAGGSIASGASITSLTTVPATSRSANDASLMETSLVTAGTGGTGRATVNTGATAAVATAATADLLSVLSVEERSYMDDSQVTEIDVDSLVKGAEKSALHRGNTPGSPRGTKRGKPPPKARGLPAE